MRLLIAGLALLAISFIAHLVIWRVCAVKRPILALLGIFAAAPLLTALISGGIAIHPVPPSLSVTDIVRIALFYVSCALVYICVYSAIEAQSPTLAIVTCIASRGGAGCTEPELAELLTAETGLRERIGLMEAGGMVVLSGDRCALTPQGRLWARVFESAGNLFVLSLGG
jgi:hypothetical protein